MFLIFLFYACCFVSELASAEQIPMTCKTGPIKKEYGHSQWLVYSCSDNKTIVIVSDTGNPASPFYFTFYIKNGKYQLSGEGTGSKTTSDTAFKELSTFDERDLKALIQETKNGKYVPDERQ